MGKFSSMKLLAKVEGGNKNCNGETALTVAFKKGFYQYYDYL